MSMKKYIQLLFYKKANYQNYKLSHSHSLRNKVNNVK